MKLNHHRFAALLLALVMAVSLAACAKQDAPAAEESAPAAETAPAETPAPLALIGQEAEGEYVYSLRLTNRTGAEIVGVSVKDNAAETYPDNMLPEGETFAAGEARMLWYDATAAMEAAKAAMLENPDEPELWPAFYMQLTLADGTVQELHMLPLGDAEACDLFLGDGIAYVIYTSLSTKETVNTQAFEQAAQDDAAAAETPAPQPVQQPAQPVQQPTQSVQQPTQPVQQPTQPVQQPTQPTEPDDGCVEDGLVW